MHGQKITKVPTFGYDANSDAVAESLKDTVEQSLSMQMFRLI